MMIGRFVSEKLFSFSSSIGGPVTGSLTHSLIVMDCRTGYLGFGRGVYYGGKYPLPNGNGGFVMI